MLSLVLCPDLLHRLRALRRELRQNPELSGQERSTNQRLRTFLARYAPDCLIPDLGGTGCAAIDNGAEPGSTLAIRGDIDALPIQERTTCAHRSQHSNVAHLCGRDGR